MILIGQLDSPHVRRVAIAMHLLGLRFEHEPLSVFGDAEALRRINPLGRVPALVLDDGEVLIETAAILDHLDEVAGADRALLPASGADRRRALHLTALATGAFDKALAIVYEQRLRPADKQHQPWLDRCRLQLDHGLAALEAVTGDGWYLGGRPMLPDVTAACVIGYLQDRLADAVVTGVPRLHRLAAALEQTPAFVAAARP